jgi:hypothetical protein
MVDVPESHVECDETVPNRPGRLGIFDYAGEDVLRHLLSYLEDKVLAKFRLVCRWFYHTCTIIIRNVRLSNKELDRMDKDPKNILKLVQL